MHGHKNADARREQRRRAENQNQQRDDFGGFLHGEKIPHHRHGRDLRGATAQRLHKTQGDEPFHGARTEAEQGRRNEQEQPGIQRQFASEPVQQRAVKKLAGGQPGKITGQRQGNPGGGRVQRAGDLGKRRQIHVNGERADGGKRAQDEDDQIAVRGCVHKKSSGRLQKWHNAAVGVIASLCSSPGVQIARPFHPAGRNRVFPASDVRPFWGRGAGRPTAPEVPGNGPPLYQSDFDRAKSGGASVRFAWMTGR